MPHSVGVSNTPEAGPHPGACLISSILQDNFTSNNALGLYDVLPCPARGALVSCLVSGAVDAWLSPAVKGLNIGTFSEETAEQPYNLSSLVGYHLMCAQKYGLLLLCHAI